MGLRKIADALTLAGYAGLDLVLMSENAVPPVAKIMDYNKYRYEKSKKLKRCSKKTKRSQTKNLKNIVYLLE
jgi:translation initiation factor IF-3